MIKKIIQGLKRERGTPAKAKKRWIDRIHTNKLNKGKPNISNAGGRQPCLRNPLLHQQYL